MQIKSSRHGFANAGLVLMLAVAWAWVLSGPITRVSASTTDEQTVSSGPESKTNASSPHAQGEDVQAQAGQTQAVQAGASELPILHNFVATAYCVKGPTYSGLQVRSGMIAADPRVLPIGSIVRVIAGDRSGIYSVLDTGPLVSGRRIDIFMPEVSDARKFGRRKVEIQVLRYGWSPTADRTVVADMHR